MENKELQNIEDEVIVPNTEEEISNKADSIVASVFGSTEEIKEESNDTEVVDNNEDDNTEVVNNKEDNSENNTEESSTTSEELMPLDFEISKDDIKKSVEDLTINDNHISISNESAVEILKLISKIKEDKTYINHHNIYREFPQELKDLVDQYILTKGGILSTAHSPQYNGIRNSIAKSLLQEFIMYINLNHSDAEFNKEMGEVFKDLGVNISQLYKDYNRERTNYLAEILNNIPEDNVEKREVVTKTIDAIADSYNLTRLKEAAPTMKKIRRIEMEKPRQRAFSYFENKYKDSQYNMYSLDDALKALNKHNPVGKDDPYWNTKFLVAFCRFCDKYSPSVVYEHSFMFYTIYNIISLNVYYGEDYNQFAEQFFKNINEVIELLKTD